MRLFQPPAYGRVPGRGVQYGAQLRPWSCSSRRDAAAVSKPLEGTGTAVPHVAALVFTALAVYDIRAISQDLGGSRIPSAGDEKLAQSRFLLLGKDRDSERVSFVPADATGSR